MFYEGEYVYEYAGERLSLEEGEKHRPSLKPKGHNWFYIFNTEHGSVQNVQCVMKTGFPRWKSPVKPTNTFLLSQELRGFSKIHH